MCKENKHIDTFKSFCSSRSNHDIVNKIRFSQIWKRFWWQATWQKSNTLYYLLSKSDKIWCTALEPCGNLISQIVVFANCKVPMRNTKQQINFKILLLVLTLLALVILMSSGFTYQTNFYEEISQKIKL